MNLQAQKETDNKLNSLNPMGYTSLVDVFNQACQQFHHQIAFSCQGDVLDYEELGDLTDRLATYLLGELKLNKGDRVAVHLPNCTAFPVIAWGVLKAGLVLVNINPLYTQRELAHQLRDSGAVLAFTSGAAVPGFMEVLTVGKGVADIAHIIHVGEFAGDHAVASNGINVQPWQTLLANVEAKPELFPDLTMKDIALLQYTGGTTGPAKGAILTQGNVFASAMQSQSILPPQEARALEDAIIMPLPLYHIFGFVMSIVNGCLQGVHSVLIANASDLDSVIQAMKDNPFMCMGAVNTLYAALMRHPQFDTIDFSRLQVSIAGGTALMSSIADEWQQRTASTILEGYGLSETAASATCNKVDANQLGSVGKALPGIDVKVVDTENLKLANGQEGELLIRGPQVMQGYWNRPEASAEVIDQEGWFRTGDVAIIQDDGFIRIVDRIKDMIIVSGFNVYPNEIEDVASAHPGIVECAVVGVADERTSEAVKLFAVRSDPALDEQTVRDYCREQLAGYKVPKHVEFLEALPKSTVGKILRRELKQ
ncbi:long-chain fatty acid--CoA ligase [Maricurvus nonylphenolicus]|uniref:AMP-binding protein n=1 Tax=Maricurvus nonylphenolicus TaxID=1008307 RepID=UPI0036F3059B